MNNYGYPPIYTLPGGFDLEQFIKFQDYIKATNPHRNKPAKAKSEIKEFLRLWNAFKEADEKKKKEEDEKKKKDAVTKAAMPTLSLGQAFMFCLTFGLPIGAAWLSVLEASFTIVKGILFK